MDVQDAMVYLTRAAEQQNPTMLNRALTEIDDDTLLVVYSFVYASKKDDANFLFWAMQTILEKFEYYEQCARLRDFTVKYNITYHGKHKKEKQ